MILFILTLFFSFGLEAQVSCPTRPVRLDHRESLPMAPIDSSGNKVDGSLVGAEITDQGLEIAMLTPLR